MRKSLREQEFQRKLGTVFRHTRMRLQMTASTRRAKQDAQRKSLALELGLTHSCISNWEAGIRAPSVFNIARAARAMKLKPEELGALLLESL